MRYILNIVPEKTELITPRKKIFFPKREFFFLFLLLKGRGAQKENYGSIAAHVWMERNKGINLRKYQSNSYEFLMRLNWE